MALTPQSADRAAADLLPMAARIEQIAARLGPAEQAAVIKFFDDVTLALNSGALPTGQTRPETRRPRTVIDP